MCASGGALCGYIPVIKYPVRTLLCRRISGGGVEDLIRGGVAV
jgi:hypothetical protein